MEKLDALIKTPCITIQLNIGKIACTWLNTTMRRYANPNMNHIHWEDERNIIRFITDDETWETFFEEDFPMVYQPLPEIHDKDAIEWYDQMIAAELTGEGEANPLQPAD